MTVSVYIDTHPLYAHGYAVYINYINTYLFVCMDARINLHSAISLTCSVRRFLIVYAFAFIAPLHTTINHIT